MNKTGENCHPGCGECKHHDLWFSFGKAFEGCEHPNRIINYWSPIEGHYTRPASAKKLNSHGQCKLFERDQPKSKWYERLLKTGGPR
jgi:hypothetical protein